MRCEGGAGESRVGEGEGRESPVGIGVKKEGERRGMEKKREAVRSSSAVGRHVQAGGWGSVTLCGRGGGH